MKIKKLYVYGDSFVHGDGLDQNFVWPNLLAIKLGANVENRGAAGGSNKLSLHRLFRDLADLKKFSKSTLIIFAWTSIHRSCYWDTIDNEWYNFLVNFRNKNHIKKITEEVYYNYIHSDFDAVQTQIIQAITVQSFLALNDIKYFFINSFRDEEDGSRLMFDELKPMEQLILKDKYLLGYENSIRKEVCIKKALLGKDKFHPCTQGHNLASDLILQDLKSKL